MSSPGASPPGSRSDSRQGSRSASRSRNDEYDEENKPLMDSENNENDGNTTTEQTEDVINEHPEVQADRKRTQTKIIIGVVAGVAVLAMVITLVFLPWKTWFPSKDSGKSGDEKIGIKNCLAQVQIEEDFDARLQAADKPAVENRDFAYKKFDNGVQYIAIQDSKSKKAATVTLVDAGSLRNPDGIYGLAHLLEHTVFTGSKNYNGRSNFEDWKRQYFGQSNAFTTNDITVYYLDIIDEGLDEGVKRSADFVFYPTLEAISEANAVDSEHTKNIPSPAWRRQSTWNYVFDPEGLGRFTTGSKETLSGRHILQDLKDFHKHWYLPKRVTMVTISPRTVEEQLEMVGESEFLTVGNPSPEDEFVDERPFIRSPQYNEFIHMYNEESPVPTLFIRFPMVDINLDKKYRAGFESYLVHVFDYEGMKTKQGLKSYLLDSEWILGCDVELDWTEYYATFVFQVTLRSVEHRDKVIAEFFKYLKLVRSKIDMNLYNWLGKTSAFLWKWTKQTGSRSDIAISQAVFMNSEHPFRELLSSGKILPEPEYLYSELLGKRIRPERMDILFTEKAGKPMGMLGTSELKKDKTPFYDIEFEHGKLPQSMIQLYEKILYENPNDFYDYSLPDVFLDPPEIEKDASEFLLISTPDFPHGESPRKLSGGMYYRWGSIMGVPSFKFVLRLSSEMQTNVFSTPMKTFYKTKANWLMWGSMFQTKIRPILAKAQTCNTSVSIDSSSNTNYFALTIGVAGHYSSACDEITKQVLDVLMALDQPGKSAQACLREGDDSDGKQLVARTTEALYNSLIDDTNSKPTSFAEQGLALALAEGTLPYEALAVEVKKTRDDRFALLRETPLSSGDTAHYGESIPDYDPQKPTLLPDKMNKPTEIEKKGTRAIPDMNTIEDVDAFVVSMLKGEFSASGDGNSEQMKMYGDGMVFGGIEKDKAIALRDKITAQINSLRSSDNKISFSPRPPPIDYRAIYTPVDVESYNKRKGDKNDVTLVIWRKNAKFSIPAHELVVPTTEIEGIDGTKVNPADGFSPPPKRIFTSIREHITHQLIDSVFSSYVFTKLRTEAIDKVARYVARGSITAGVGHYDVRAVLQSSGEDLNAIMKEIEGVVLEKFLPHLEHAMDNKTFQTAKSSLLSLYSSPPDSQMSEFHHFLGKLNAPIPSLYVKNANDGDNPEIPECVFQPQLLEKKIVQQITKEEVIDAWKDFLDKTPGKITRRTSVVYGSDYQDGGKKAKPLDPKKTVASYLKAKTNRDNLQFGPVHGGTVECTLAEIEKARSHGLGPDMLKPSKDGSVAQQTPDGGGVTAGASPIAGGTAGGVPASTSGTDPPAGTPDDTPGAGAASARKALSADRAAR